MRSSALKALGALLVLSAAACEAPQQAAPPSTAAPDRVTQGQMPAFCRGEASARFNQRPQDIATLPAERSGSMFVVYGQYPQGNPTSFFTCTFSADGELVGVDRQ